jgi:hypothetical protein
VSSNSDPLSPEVDIDEDRDAEVGVAHVGACEVGSRQMPVPKRFASEVLTAVISDGGDVATSLVSPSPLGQDGPAQ